MGNAFDDLFSEEGQAKPVREEVIGGSFACQHGGCYKVVTKASYVVETKVLHWICPEGHVSIIEDFEL